MRSSFLEFEILCVGLWIYGVRLQLFGHFLFCWSRFNPADLERSRDCAVTCLLVV